MVNEYYQNLVKQHLMYIKMKFIYEYDDGTYEELNGIVKDGVIFNDNNKNFFDMIIKYDNLIIPLKEVKIYIGILNVKNKSMVWFNQGTYRFNSKYSYVETDLSKAHFVGTNCESISNLKKDIVLENDFISNILINESKELSFYEPDDKSGAFYITTKLCPFANICAEIHYKRTDSNKICTYSVESYLHDLKNGTTKWGVK